MSQDDLTSIRPVHLAIIMDGNGRWAKAKGFPRLKGHEEGAKRVMEIAEEAEKLGISYLSLFAFSTENWKRSSREVNVSKILNNPFTSREDRFQRRIGSDLLGK